MQIIIETSEKFEKNKNSWGAGSANWKDAVDVSDFINLHGTFAVIREFEDEIQLVCDHIRSIALFYYVNKGYIIVSDQPDYIIKHSKSKINKKLQEEYEFFFYVTEDDTMLECVHTVLPGQVVKISKVDASISKQQYFEWNFSGTDTRSEDTLAEEFDEILTDVFRDLLERVDGKPIVIPLSGGMDSRTIAHKCTQFGYKDITAFTYGRKGFSEIVNAQKVVDSFGIKKYYQVICDDTTCKKWLAFDEWRKSWHYTALYCNRTTSVSKSLLYSVREQGGIPSNAVIISGSALDFTAGSHLPALENAGYTYKDAFDFLYESHKLKRSKKLKKSMCEKWKLSLTPPPRVVTAHQ